MCEGYWRMAELGANHFQFIFCSPRPMYQKQTAPLARQPQQKVLQTQPSCSTCKYVHIGHVVKSNGANWKSVLICSTVNIWCTKLCICIQYALYCWFQLTHSHSILRHSSTVKIMPLCMDACKIQPPPGATSFSRSGATTEFTMQEQRTEEES